LDYCIYFLATAEASYSRIRHYKGTEAGKPKFSYCQQSKNYAETKLKEYLSSKDVNKVSAGLARQTIMTIWVMPILAPLNQK
jgi:hypothetical protein